MKRRTGQDAFGCTRWLARGSGLAISATPPAPDRRSQARGCAAANSGALNADLAAGAAVTRELALDAGDILTVSAHGAAGATASVALVSGAGAPRP